MAILNRSTAELIVGKEWNALADKLCSLAYIQEKADTGRIFDLILEFDGAIAAIPSSHPASAFLPVIAGSLRRNASFLSRHPASAFQSFWNLCWWHDCPRRGDFARMFPGHAATFAEAVYEAGPVSRLMESWRSQKLPGGPGSCWVRSLLPPSTSFGGQLRLEIPINTDGGRPAALSLSKAHLVAWSRQGRYMQPHIWNRHTGEPIPDIDREHFPFGDPSVSPDSSLKISFGGEDGGWGHPVTVLDICSGGRVASFAVDEDHNVSCVAFSPDGRSIVAGAYGIEYEGYAYVWDLTSTSLRTVLRLRSCVGSVSFSPGSDEILLGRSDGMLEIWKLATDSVRRSIPAHDAGIIHAVFSSDEKSIASMSHDGTLRLWDLDANPVETRFAPHPGEVVELKFSPSGDRLVTRSSNGTTWLWNGHTGRPIRCLYESSHFFKEGGDSKNCLFVGNHMIVSLASGGGVWTSSEGDLLADVADRVSLSESVCFSADGKRFALWGLHGRTDSITIHDIRTGDLTGADAQTDLPGDETSGKGGHFVLTLMADGEFRSRRMPDRVELARIDAHTGGIICCAFSPDNRLLVSVGSDRTMKVWEWETATVIFTATVDKSQHPIEEIQGAKFIDDHTIAAAVGEAEIVAWDLQSGLPVNIVPWAGTFEEYPRQVPCRAEVRGDEVCIVDNGTGNEVAWFPCGRSLGSTVTVVANPSGDAWAGMVGTRLFYFVLDSDPAA